MILCCPSVVLCCLSVELFPRHLRCVLMDFHQTFAASVSDELIRLWDQRSKVKVMYLPKVEVMLSL